MRIVTMQMLGARILRSFAVDYHHFSIPFVFICYLLVFSFSSILVFPCRRWPSMISCIFFQRVGVHAGRDWRSAGVENQTVGFGASILHFGTFLFRRGARSLRRLDWLDKIGENKTGSGLQRQSLIHGSIHCCIERSPGRQGVETKNMDIVSRHKSILHSGSEFTVFDC